MPVDMAALCADLAAEHAALDAIVAPLDDAGWARPTPAEGWDVRDQIAHLAYFDGAAVLAATDPEAFEREELNRALSDHEGYAAHAVGRGRSMPGGDVLAWWRDARGALLETFRALDPKQRVPWFGPPMSAASKVTARLMETWAHGQDVVDALGATRAATDRLRHVAHIAVGARGFSYAAHGREAPADPVRVELVAPSGDTWVWGPDDAMNVVRGPALDFCLVLTQRRHPADTALVADGALAEEWLAIGQAFAGPPGAGRRPGQFA